MSEQEMPRRFLAEASNRLADATKLLEHLVNLDTCSRAPTVLATASEWIADQLRELGFDVEQHTAASYGPTVVGRKSGGGRHRILLLGHYDTVFEPGEPARRPFRLEGARAFGPGVADMKAGVVVAWEALRVLNLFGWDNFKSITIIHNGDEEITSASSRSLIEGAARGSDVCIVFEPGRPDGSIISERKGVGRFTLTIHGKAAHAGAAPHEGASAVVSLAHKILALNALNDPDRGLTVNSVVLEGGTRSNIVPDRAVAEVDIRIPALINGDAIVAMIEKIVHEEHVPGTRAVLLGGIHRPPFAASPAGPALVALAREAAAVLGLRFGTLSSGGGSDGNFASALGVPVLDGMGAIGRGYHTTDESIEVATVPERAALAALTMWKACQREVFLRRPH
jgi:glutamate carboxypeptidase